MIFASKIHLALSLVCAGSFPDRPEPQTPNLALHATKNKRCKRLEPGPQLKRDRTSLNAITLSHDLLAKPLRTFPVSWP
jgi:hypothetical protein